MTYIDAGGVKTWYEEYGSGDALVLLHGGLTDASEFGMNIAALAERFHVFTPERRGHGHTPDVPGPISYELMAEDTAAFLEMRGIGRAHLVGHSDGAIVALLVGLGRPDLVDRLVLISGNYHYDGLVAELDLNELTTNEYIADAYARVSPDGPEHFPVFANKVLRMVTTEPTMQAADLGAVTARTLVLAGDDDMVSAEHTLSLYRGIPNSELAIVPGTSHALILEKPDLCNRIILDFLTMDAVRTFLPFRRA